MVGTSCSPAPCSQQGGGGGALPPASSPQGSSPGSPPAPGRCPPAPCSSPTPAGAGRASATFLIYSTPLEHARDPNGAPGTAGTGLRERSGGSRPGRWNSSGTKGLRSRQEKAIQRGDTPYQGDPRAHSSAGCPGGEARPQPRPRLQGKAWRAEPGSNARKIRKKKKKAGKPRKTKCQEEDERLLR